MSSQLTTRPAWAVRVERVFGAILAAGLTGAADPPAKNRPWPVGLRWTRWILIGRLPFGLALNVAAALLAVGLLAGTNSLLLTEVPKRDPGYPNDLLLLAAALVTLPLALIDRYPLAAWRLLVIGMAATGGHNWLTVPYLPAGTAISLVSLFVVALRCSRRITLGVGIISVAGVFLVDGGSAPGATALLLVPLLIGYAIRQRQTSRRELAAQARRHREAEAVLKERQRIARELHDVVAHHMSMIAIQAEAAPYKVEDVPDETRRDLAEIRSTALDALTEMRRILGVLRSEDGADTAPQPSLARLDELVANARGAGLTVDLRAAPDLPDLPSGVGLTAYRILQEALSNAMRHAPGSKVVIEIVPADGILRMSVINGPARDGHAKAPSPPGQGHGLVGMRERAAMLGGELTAAPTPEGGFAVTATLPLQEPQ
ncbi:sensor histidine kinase [Spirillospora sp. CA-294931]|uniref:sensor histidine kinase n=1 Tax=Spirillospora sp. CA-294931 TaxID=3240042 RepID=UPI003D913F19